MGQIKITATGPLEETTKFFDADDFNGQMKYLERIKKRHHEFLDHKMVHVSKKTLKRITIAGQIWSLRPKRNEGMRLTVNIEHVD